MSEDGGGGSGWARPGWGEPQPGEWSPPTGGSPGWHSPGSTPPGSTPGPPPPGSPPPGAPAPPGAPPYGWGPSGWQDPAPKPGVVPLRPLGLGEILDGAITTVRRHPKLTIGLAALVVTVEQVISAVVAAVTGNVSGSAFPAPGNGFSTSEFNGSIGFTDVFHTSSLIGTGVELVVGGILGALLTGMLVVVVGEAVIGRSIEFAELWERVRPRFWGLLGGSLLSGLLPLVGLPVAVIVGILVGATAGAAAGAVTGLLVGLLLLVVPGAIFWGLFALTAPALMLEHIGPIDALRRSWRLARPDFFRVWGIRALATIIAAVIAGVIAVPFTLVASFAVAANGSGSVSGGALTILIIVGAVSGIVGGAIVQPFVSGVLALLYIDRRIRGEGLDIALAQAARASASAPAGPA